MVDTSRLGEARLAGLADGIVELGQADRPRAPMEDLLGEAHPTPELSTFAQCFRTMHYLESRAGFRQSSWHDVGRVSCVGR